MKKEQKKKLAKGIDETFLDSINGLKIDELKARIVQLQVQNEENELFKESEAYTKAKAEFDYAKEQYQLVVGPVKETTTIIKNKTKEIIQRLKEKGGV
jgi:hypothetical protein